MKAYPKAQPKSNNTGERIAILRSAHGRADGSTFTTSASFIIAADGVRLLAGRHVTRRAAGALTRNAEAFERDAPNVRAFPRRTSPATADRRAA